MEGDYQTSTSPRHPLARSDSDAYVLQMEEPPQANQDVSCPPHIEKDVCYPIPPTTTTLSVSSQSTIDKDALGNYLQVDEDDDTLTKSDAKLDFLLDASQNKHSRRFSDFGDTVMVSLPFLEAHKQVD
jgi:magnesium transporter